MSYYIIKSKLTGLVLDVEGGGRNIGARVITWDRSGADNQIFYDDPATGTIRSKASQYCLDIENEQLCVRELQPGDPNQQWRRVDQHIRNGRDQNRVLDIMNNSRDKGAKIGAWQFNGGANQSWEFEHVQGQPPIGGGGYPGGSPGYPPASGYPGQPGYGPPGGYPGGQQPGGYPPQGGYPGQPQGGYPPQGGPGGYPPQGGYPSQPEYPAGGGFGGQRREFFIVSELNSKAVDIERGNASQGTKIMMWPKSGQPSKNQLWYQDPQGCIRSALNDMTFVNHGSGHALKMQPGSGDPRSQWAVVGNSIHNRAGEALDISRGSKDNGAELISYKPHSKPNQRWRLEYV